MKGYPVSQEALDRTNKIIAAMRKEQNQKRRAEIRLLSNKDITIMAADVIVAAVPLRGKVTEHDFDNAGLPIDRVRLVKDQAMALARKKEPRIDAMLLAGMAA